MRKAASHPFASEVQPVGSVLDQQGESQRRLLGELLQRPEGLTVAELVRALGIAANAVRQHLAVLEKRGFVAYQVKAAARGRPAHFYRLTQHGQEVFPRRYRELAEGLMSELGELLGETELRSAMRRSGSRAARALSAIPISVTATAEAMARIGYEARSARGDDGRDEIVAMNCVFHSLAARFPTVCEFDLAFMEAATGQQVEHRECMVRGGNCCRFSFKGPKK
jgi:predicted ArsR family transcriptional regulator